MKKINILLFLAVACFAVCLRPLPGQTKKIPAKRAETPAPTLFCPDIQVAAFKATLVSTQVGDTSIDFPHDTVRLHVKLLNGGSAAVPSGTVLHIVIKRNGEVVHTEDPVSVLGIKGSIWTMNVNDTFPHNLKITYSVQVSSPIQECTLANNQSSFNIDEAQLHPGGSPDLTCSLFTVEKRWHHEGNLIKGTCFFSADVSNIGKGFCKGDSKLLFPLKDYVNAAEIPIREADLPAPGYKKRFQIEVPDSQVPYGTYQVSAYIQQAANEPGGWRANNRSGNTAILNNLAEPPKESLAKIQFPPWGMLGRVLNVRIEIRPQGYDVLRGLRVILLKNNALIREWKNVDLDTKSSGNITRLNCTDDRPETENMSGPDRYRVILTSDAGSGIPSENAIMAEGTRPLNCMEMAESLLESYLQEPITGLGQMIHKDHNDITLDDKKTHVKISPESMMVRVEGDKRLKGGAKASFTAWVGLKAHARNGKIAADVIDKKIHAGSVFTEIMIILLPGIGYGIVHGIEKSFESLIPGDFSLGVGGLSPCGVVLIPGAMYIYHPYSL